jgi:uracil-DNA glycosylase
MKAPTFAPHIPAQFDGTLILAESTFRGPDPDTKTGWPAALDKGFPKSFIKNHVQDNTLNDDRTFRKLRESFAPILDAEEFWARKAFTNFVPDLLDTSQSRPTAEQWLAGQQEFPWVLDVVKPRRILVVGLGLWEHLPEGENEQRDQCFYRSASIVAMCIPHPSAWNRLKPKPYTYKDAQRVTSKLMSYQ